MNILALSRRLTSTDFNAPHWVNFLAERHINETDTEVLR